MGPNLHKTLPLLVGRLPQRQSVRQDSKEIRVDSHDWLMSGNQLGSRTRSAMLDKAERFDDGQTYRYLRYTLKRKKCEDVLAHF